MPIGLPDDARRRSPGWVRSMESRNVHALAFRLRNRFMVEGISSAEEWLLDACISELEYRRRRALRARSWSACACELCKGGEAPPVDLPGFEL